MNHNFIIIELMNGGNTMPDNLGLEIMTCDGMLTMTVHQMAEKIGCSYPSAYELVNRKDFPKLKIGKKYLIPVAEFYHWLNNQHD